MLVDKDGLLIWQTLTSLSTTNLVPPIQLQMHYLELRPDVLSQTETEEYESMPANLVQAICLGVVCETLIDNTACGLSVLPLEDHIPGQRGWNKDDWVLLQSQDPDLKIIIDCFNNNTIKKRHFQPNDSKTLKHYFRIQNQLKLIDGVLYRRTLSNNSQHQHLQHQIVLPKELFARVMQGCHDETGHQGRDRTVSLVRERFYWDTLYKDTSDYVAQCPRCLRRKGTTRPALLQPFFATQPLEIIHLDHLTLDPCKGQFESVLVVTDHFTRYAQAYAVKNQTALTTAKVLWEQFLRHYGFPQKRLTDQGPGFESQLFQELMNMARIENLRTSSYHPQTNGQCERFNSTLMNMLGTLTPDQKKDWKSHLLTMCHAYNSTQHSVTGYSPYYLMFGRHPRLPIDYQLGLTRDNLTQPFKFKFVNKLNERLQEAYAKAEALTQEEANRQKKLYDRRSKDVVLTHGNLDLVRIVKWTERHKIQDKWEQEEYVVVSQPDPFLPVYKVRPISGGNTRTLHRNLLLPLGLQMKSIEDQDSSDIAFDEVRERPSAPPEVGIFPDGPSVHPSSDNLNLSTEEEAGKMDDIPSTIGKDPLQTENIADLRNEDIDIDTDNYLDGLTEFWELIEPNVNNDEDIVSETRFSLLDVDEPITQEIDRGLPDSLHEQSMENENDKETPEAMKSGNLEKKLKSCESLKTYPKRSSRNKPPKYYGWSAYNPLKWI